MYMYVDICIFMYMYIACTYSSRLVHNFINMYIHVCTMYRALCTDLHILVHVVRIPDEGGGVYRVGLRRAESELLRREGDSDSASATLALRLAVAAGPH